MNQLKDAYLPDDGKKYEIVKLITNNIQNQQEPQHHSMYGSWMEATETVEKYLRVTSEDLDKFTSRGSEKFENHVTNRDGIIEFNCTDMNRPVISSLNNYGVVTDVINAKGTQLPGIVITDLIKNHVRENGKLRTNTKEFIRQAHMKNGDLHSPTLADGSCKHALVTDSSYKYEDGRINEQYKTAKHALDGKVGNIIQQNGKIAWAQTLTNCMTGEQRNTSVVGDVEQKVITIPDNILTTGLRKKMASENTASLNPSRPVALKNITQPVMAL
jgi:hypothetical protein